MSQYAMTESSSQEDQALSEQVAQQLQRFVQPFLRTLGCLRGLSFGGNLVADDGGHHRGPHEFAVVGLW